MSSQILFEDRWGEIIDRPQLGLVELRWYDSTVHMTSDEFSEWLSTYASCVEAKNRPGCLIDSVQFKMPFKKIDTYWRDENIIPRYNAAGVKKFAFLIPEGMPTIGADQMPAGPATYPTRYFYERAAATAWISESAT